MVSYVNVDYEKIDSLIKKRGTSRSKCADACGIHRSTLGNSFLRKSKLNVDLLRKIADFLEVQPIELIEHDEDGNILHYKDWDAVTGNSIYSSYDKEMDQLASESFRDLYFDLNQAGRTILYDVAREVSDLLHKIPEYLIDAPDCEENDIGKL